MSKVIKLFYILPFLVLAALVLAIVAGVFGGQHRRGFEDLSRERLNELYNFLITVNPSNLNPQLKTMVEDRIRCYADVPSNRLTGLCKDSYANSLIKIGRRGIASAPNLGGMLREISLCPIVYSVCRGHGDGGDDDQERCVYVESQCLDGLLDYFWRGEPLDVF
ncbi:MAG: hypothetical protein LBT86_00860 [Deltaproteobacteria bacterium]|jgi:hypothetical protein|nr:hypothetical protein [Deltaproteobacteria bacterium]